MIKKIFTFLILACLIVSCGKKGDPEFNEPEKRTMLQDINKNKA